MTRKVPPTNPTSIEAVSRSPIDRSDFVRFQANRDVFSEAVSFAVKLLPQRTTLPILSGVLIEATETGLILSSFDY